MKSILDRSFHYTSSASTDLRKTFARIRREQRKRVGAEGEAEADVKTNVLPIKQRRAGASEVMLIASENS
jgi:hypothetical protein